MRYWFGVIVFSWSIGGMHYQSLAADSTPEQLEFFEKRVRPILATHCYECHSAKAKKLKAGLRLDSRDGVLKGGDSGTAVQPGKPADSLLIQSVKYQSYEMPPKGKLPETAIAALVEWVKIGVPWPKEKSTVLVKTGEQIDWAKARQKHWAFQPVIKPRPPVVKNREWPKSPIDHFVLARLESAGLAPSAHADPRTLIRRTYFDLIGLPPTPAEVDAFVKDPSATAYARVIDQLLDSPHYGERWGRYWLDVARYSDGFGGFLDNAALPNAWHYRDWVIDAFNRDLPYDDFVKQQIAGDLINVDDSHIGPGFFAIGPTYRSDGGDPDSKAQAQSETLDDRIDTLSRGFLGLTVSCARCHDHKFDPIPTLDYYSLAGIFNNTKNQTWPLASKAVVDRYNQRQAAIKTLDQKIKKTQADAKKAKRKLTADEQAALSKQRKELDQLRKTAPPMYPFAHSLAESGKSDMRVALRGNLRKPGPVAPRRFLRILAGEDPATFSNGSGRLELADAVADAKNPLTARVFVNRVWMHHFGKALVRSPSNFGSLGEKPTHPLLLDWLAANFVEFGWSIKSLHRTIMLSAVYQMSSHHHDDNFNVDGDNRLLWRMNPRRLDVESWRDALLAVTGELDRNAGGPPIEAVNHRRRTVYFKASRNGDRFASDEFLRLFDFPLMRATVAKRPTSIVPQQFLFMMNSTFMIDRAKALVVRLDREAKVDDRRIELAYRLLFGRSPTTEEQELALAFVGTSPNPPSPKPKSASPKSATPSGDDLIIADFEGNSYGSWQLTGEAFGPRPAQGTLPGQMAVSGFRGKGLVNTFYNGDRTTGTLMSPPFKLQRKYINFLVGGGKYPGTTCINLLVDGKQVRTATGPNNRGGGTERLAWHAWDVAEFAGKNARLEIVDRRTGGWGHINVDHIYQSSKKPDKTVVPTRVVPAVAASKLSRWQQYAQVLLSCHEFMYVR